MHLIAHFGVCIIRPVPRWLLLRTLRSIALHDDHLSSTPTSLLGRINWPSPSLYCDYPMAGCACNLRIRTQRPADCRFPVQRSWAHCLYRRPNICAAPLILLCPTPSHSPARLASCATILALAIIAISTSTHTSASQLRNQTCASRHFGAQNAAIHAAQLLNYGNYHDRSAKSLLGISITLVTSNSRENRL